MAEHSQQAIDITPVAIDGAVIVDFHGSVIACAASPELAEVLAEMTNLGAMMLIREQAERRVNKRLAMKNAEVAGEVARYACNLGLKPNEKGDLDQ